SFRAVDHNASVGTAHFAVAFFKSPGPIPRLPYSSRDGLVRGLLARVRLSGHGRKGIADEEGKSNRRGSRDGSVHQVLRARRPAPRLREQSHVAGNDFWRSGHGLFGFRHIRSLATTNSDLRGSGWERF